MSNVTTKVSYQPYNGHGQDDYTVVFFFLFYLYLVDVSSAIIRRNEPAHLGAPLDLTLMARHEYCMLL